MFQPLEGELGASGALGAGLGALCDWLCLPGPEAEGLLRCFAPRPPTFTAASRLMIEQVWLVEVRATVWSLGELALAPF